MSDYQAGSRPKPQVGKGSTLATSARFSRHTDVDNPDKHTERPVSSPKPSPTKKENSQHHHSSSTDSGRSSISGSHCGEVGESTSKDVSSSIPATEANLSNVNDQRLETSTMVVKTSDDVSSSSPLTYSDDGHQLRFSKETGAPCNDLDIYSDVTLIPRVSETLTVIYKSGRPCVKRVSRSKGEKAIRKQKSLLQPHQQLPLKDSATVKQSAEAVVTSSSSSQTQLQLSVPDLTRKDKACGKPVPLSKRREPSSDRNVDEIGLTGNLTTNATSDTLDHNGNEDNEKPVEEEQVGPTGDPPAAGLVLTIDHFTSTNSSTDQISTQKSEETDNRSNQAVSGRQSPIQDKSVTPNQIDEPDLFVSSTNALTTDDKVPVLGKSADNSASSNCSNQSSSNGSVYSNKTASSVNSGTEHSSPEYKVSRDVGLRTDIPSFRISSGHASTNEFTRRRTRLGSSPALPRGSHNMSPSNRALQRNLPYHVRPLLVQNPYGTPQANNYGLLPTRRSRTDKQKQAFNPSYSVQQPGNPVSLLPTSILSQPNSCMCLQPIDPLTLLVNPGFTWLFSPGNTTSNGEGTPRGRFISSPTGNIGQLEVDAATRAFAETVEAGENERDKQNVQSTEIVQRTKEAVKVVSQHPEIPNIELILNDDANAVILDTTVPQSNGDSFPEASEVTDKSTTESPESDVTSTATTIVNKSQGSDAVQHSTSSSNDTCDVDSATSNTSISASCTSATSEGVHCMDDFRMFPSASTPKDTRAGYNPMVNYSAPLESCFVPAGFVYVCNSDGQLFAMPSTAFICHPNTAQSHSKFLNGEGVPNSELGSSTDSAYSSPPSLGPGFTDSRLLPHTYATNHVSIGNTPMFDSVDNRTAIPVSTVTYPTEQDIERPNVFTHTFYSDGQQQQQQQQHQQLVHPGIPYPTGINASPQTAALLQSTYLGELSGWSTATLPVWPNDATGMASLQSTSSAHDIQPLLLPSGAPLFTSIPLHLNLGLPSVNTTSSGNPGNEGLLSIDQQAHYAIAQHTPSGQIKSRHGNSSSFHRHLAPTSMGKPPTGPNRIVSTTSLPPNTSSTLTFCPATANGGHQRHTGLNSDTKTSRLCRVSGDSVGLLGGGGVTKVNSPQPQVGAGGSKLSKGLHHHHQQQQQQHHQQQEQTEHSRGFDEYGSRASQSGQSHAAKQKKHTSKTNLYIRGLPSTYTEDQLHKLAPDRDLIRSVKLIAGSEGEMYGFIDFMNNAAAKLALVHIKSINRDLYVNFAYESEKDPHNVYITNIPETWTATNVEDLKKIFQLYGQIATAIVMTKRSNNFCTGAGFVRFTKAEDAQKAIDEIRSNKIMLEGGRGPLEVKLADRQKPLEDQASLQSIDGIELVRAADLHILRNPYISGRQRSVNKKFNGDDTRYALSESSSLADTGGHRHYLGHVMRRPLTNSCFSPHISNEEGYKSVLRAPPVSLMPSGIGAGLLPNPQHTGSLVHNGQNNLITGPINYPSAHGSSAGGVGYVNTDGRFHTGTPLAVALQAALASAQLMQPNLLLPAQTSLNLHALPSMLPAGLSSEVTAHTQGGLLTYPTPAGHLATGFGIRNATSGALFQNATGIATANGLIPILRTIDDSITAHAGNLNFSRQHQPPFVNSGECANIANFGGLPEQLTGLARSHERLVCHVANATLECVEC